MHNIEVLYKARNKVIDFFDYYSSMVSKAKVKATKGKVLRILTLKQMLESLPIAVAQVKAGNNSQSSFKKIRQISYSLCQSKEITKKV